MGGYQSIPEDKVINFNAHDSQVSSTIPYAHKLYSDASKLANLNQTKSMKLFTESDNYDMYKLFEQNNKKAEKKEDNNFSDTSPFISSDVYKHLLNKGQQVGGGDDDEDDSDQDSSTSSSIYEKSLRKSEESDEIEEKIQLAKKASKPSKRSSKRSSKVSSKKSSVDEEYMGKTSVDSYLSSSAHDNSDSESAKISTVSLRHGSRALTESIDTSDIHLVSVEDD
jgi:hypothetical protein